MTGRGSQFNGRSGECTGPVAQLEPARPATWLDSGKIREVTFDKSESGVI